MFLVEWMVAIPPDIEDVFTLIKNSSAVLLIVALCICIIKLERKFNSLKQQLEYPIEVERNLAKYFEERRKAAEADWESLSQRKSTKWDTSNLDKLHMELEKERQKRQKLDDQMYDSSRVQACHDEHFDNEFAMLKEEKKLAWHTRNKLESDITQQEQGMKEQLGVYKSHKNENWNEIQLCHDKTKTENNLLKDQLKELTNLVNTQREEVNAIKEQIAIMDMEHKTRIEECDQKAYQYNLDAKTALRTLRQVEQSAFDMAMRENIPPGILVRMVKQMPY